LLTKKIPHRGREKFFAKIGNFYLQKTPNLKTKYFLKQIQPENLSIFSTRVLNIF